MDSEELEPVSLEPVSTTRTVSVVEGRTWTGSLDVHAVKNRIRVNVSVFSVFMFFLSLLNYKESSGVHYSLFSQKSPMSRLFCALSSIRLPRRLGDNTGGSADNGFTIISENGKGRI